jgi:hypothetical protein
MRGDGRRQRVQRCGAPQSAPADVVLVFARTVGIIRICTGVRIGLRVRRRDDASEARVRAAAAAGARCARRRRRRDARRCASALLALALALSATILKLLAGLRRQQGRFVASGGALERQCARE